MRPSRAVWNVTLWKTNEKWGDGGAVFVCFINPAKAKSDDHLAEPFLPDIWKKEKKNQTPRVLLLNSHCAHCYKCITLISISHALGETLLASSCWLEPSIFFLSQENICVWTCYLMKAKLCGNRQDETTPQFFLCKHEGNWERLGWFQIRNNESCTWGEKLVLFCFFFSLWVNLA